MRVRVVVEKGPDQGRSVQFTRGIAKIGRGPATNLSLTDPALNGHVTVGFAGTLIQVGNQTQVQILLRARSRSREPGPIERGESRPWPTNQLLQITNETLLRLETIPDAPDLRDDEFPVDGRVGRTDLDPHFERWLQVGLGLFILVSAVAYVPLYRMTHPENAAPVSKVDYEQVMRGLDELIAGPPAQKRVAEELKRMVKDGHYLEGAHRPADAYRKYDAAREALDRAAGVEVWGADPSAAPEALRDLRRFLNQRIIALSKHKDNRG